jgi:transcription antitermination protein NusB
MGKRRKARELALQALYQVDFYGPVLEDSVSLFWQDQQVGEDTVEFAQRLVEGVQRRSEEINGLIESHSEHWKLSRMSRVDRNILRMAVLELLEMDDIPYKVTIDEAIELGKKFGTGESGAFINGILDQILKRLTREEKIHKLEKA